jgi:hypothetical protein
MKPPSLIKGSSFTDSRGTLYYNSTFDSSAIKRIYIIQNSSIRSKELDSKLLAISNYGTADIKR